MARLARLGVLGAAVGLGLGSTIQPAPVLAVEWTLAADVEQRFEADSNFGLDEESEGALVGSRSLIGLRLTAETKRTVWSLNTATRLSVFGGAGDDTGLDRSDPWVSGGVFHQGKRFTASTAFSLVRTSVALAQFGLAPLPDGALPLPGGAVLLPDNTVVPLEEFETISREDATLNRLNARGGVTYSLDPRNRLSASASAVLRRFSEDATELVPTTNYGASLAWERDVTRHTETALSLGVRRFTADDMVNTESLMFTATGGFDTELTPRLSFGIDAGASLTDFRQDPPGSDDFSVDFVGGLRLDWASADTLFSLSARQSVEPSSLGDLQSRSTVGLTVRHLINQRSEISLESSFSRQVSAGQDIGLDEDRNLFVLRPTYDIDLTSRWRLSMGYQFRLSDQEEGLAKSHNVFLGLSRSFNLIH